MQIIPADKNSFPKIEEFLFPHEYSCVNLCAKVRKQEENIFVFTAKSEIMSTDDILGVICLDGSLLHCIPDPTEELLISFYSFIKDKKLKAISGEIKVTEMLIKAIDSLQKPFQVNHYQLMTLDSIVPAPPEPLSCDDQIIRCTEDSIDVLLELQKQYLIKEVAPIGKQVTDLECRISLRQVLKNQLMFALYADGELVAKANSNAIGWNYVQVGGVFTHPLYRRNYYAWHLLKVLCDRIQRTQKKVCLFVKEKNIPAIRLYERMGFKQQGNYSIAYF